MISFQNKSVHFSEKLAILFSVICAIHCVLTPVLLVMVSVLPSLALVSNSWLKMDHTMEWILLSVTAFFGFLNLWHGYQKHHHNYYPLLIFGFGLVLFFLHNLIAMEQVLHTVMALVSNLFILSAQIANVYISRKFKCAH